MSWLRPIALVLGSLVLAGCGGVGMPALEEQKTRIQRDQIAYQTVSFLAFQEAWGQPSFHYSEKTQFFPVESGAWVPRFRVPLGEPPRGWLSSVVSDQGHFVVYADRGELLAFVRDRLVYREQVSPEQVQAIKKLWEREALFRTSLESPPMPR